MIEFKKYVLDNGLRLIVHRDETALLSVFNVMYNVGSKNENPDRTGFAHLFEHLMFGGSQNIPDYDTPLQQVGAENNASTNEDYTNYYIVIPSQNIETAFWLESDRMNQLAFSPESLEVQRNVVMEEFKQRCLNQPYGDFGHLSRNLQYKVHPYRWPVIGLELNHIAEAQLDDVKKFFYDNYAPDNAVISIVGNVDPDKMFRLAEKWFGDIKRKSVKHDIPQEPVQTQRRELSVERDVPADAILIAYHMGGHLSPENKVLDMATDILAYGTSSRLIQRLVKKEHLLSQVDAGISDTMDPGILNFNGILLPGVKMETVEKVIKEEIDRMINYGVTDYELAKAINRAEADKVIGEMAALQKARMLCEAEFSGDANRINTMLETFSKVNSRDISDTLARVAVESNESVLYYYAKNN